MKINRYLTILAAAAVLCSCDGGTDPDGNGNGGSGDGGTDNPVIPEIPEEVNESNVFSVDFFTDLGSEESYFASRDWNAAVTHIESQDGKRPVAYMFDRMDFTAGEASPAVRIAYGTGYWSYFVQTESTSATVTRGTGIVTAYQIADFDSVIPHEGVFMSGTTIPVPLGTQTDICIYTTTLSSTEQFSVIASQWTKNRLNSGVTVGKILPGIKDAVSESAAADFPTLRLFYADIEGSSCDLFVLCPAAYACRGFEAGDSDTLPYYRIYFEKLF